MNMNFLVLIFALVVAISARPDVSHITNGDGYEYKAPSTSYGAPTHAVDGKYEHVHHNHHQLNTPSVPSGSYLPSLVAPSVNNRPVDFNKPQLYNPPLNIQDQKHVYFYSAPEADEEPQRLRIHIQPSAKKNTNVIFVKAPTAGPVIPEVIVPQLQSQDKTKVYVLVQKPEHHHSITVQAPEPPKPAKPEIYIVKYKDQHEAEQAIASGLGGQTIGANVGDAKDQHYFIKTLNADIRANLPQNDKYIGFDGNVDVLANLRSQGSTASEGSFTGAGSFGTTDQGASSGNSGSFEATGSISGGSKDAGSHGATVYEGISGSTGAGSFDISGSAGLDSGNTLSGSLETSGALGGALKGDAHGSINVILGGGDHGSDSSLEGSVSSVGTSSDAGFSTYGAPAVSSDSQAPVQVTIQESSHESAPSGATSSQGGSFNAGFTTYGAPAVNSESQAPVKVAVHESIPSGATSSHGGSFSAGFTMYGAPAVHADSQAPVKVTVQESIPSGVTSSHGGSFNAGFTTYGAPAVNSESQAPVKVTVHESIPSGATSSHGGSFNVGFTTYGAPAASSEAQAPVNVAIQESSHESIPSVVTSSHGGSSNVGFSTYGPPGVSGPY